MQNVPSLGFIAVYIVLLGLASFFQKPALKDLDALQLNACTAIGLAAISIVALLVRDRRLPSAEHTGIGIGIGVMMGIGSVAYFLGLRHLPVSVAATLSVTYIVITVILSMLFLHDTVTLPKVAGVVLTVAGVLLLSYHFH